MLSLVQQDMLASALISLATTFRTLYFNSTLAKCYTAVVDSGLCSVLNKFDLAVAQLVY